MRELWVPSGSEELYAVVEGLGPAVMLLHGGLGTHDHSEMTPAAALATKTSTLLTDSFTVILPDIRGRGKSVSRNPKDHTLDQYTDDVIAILDYVGVEKAAVGGRSLGALITAATALRHPERVAAMILIGPPFVPGQSPSEAQSGLGRRMSLMAELIEKQGIENAIDSAVKMGIPARTVEAFRRHDEASLLAWIRMDLLSLPFELEDLKRIVHPALVIPGMDPVHPAEAGRLWAASLPNSTLGELTSSADPTITGPLSPEEIHTLSIQVEEFLETHLSQGSATR